MTFIGVQTFSNKTYVDSFSHEFLFGKTSAASDYNQLAKEEKERFTCDDFQQRFTIFYL